jgi:hypothetical protein
MMVKFCVSPDSLSFLFLFFYKHPSPHKQAHTILESVILEGNLLRKMTMKWYMLRNDLITKGTKWCTWLCQWEGKK